MVKDQSHLSYLSSRCLGRPPGGGVRTVSECWTGKLHTPESVPELGTPATYPASSSKYSLPTHDSCPFLNNKQSRIFFWSLLYLCCASSSESHETHCLSQPIARVLGSPASSFSAPSSQIPKIPPYNALFAAFVYRVSLLFSGFGCGVHGKLES